MVLPKLKIYKDQDGHEMGYEEGALNRWMEKNWFGRSWARFIRGQTGIILEGKSIIYKWDVENFLEGRPVLD